MKHCVFLVIIVAVLSSCAAPKLSEVGPRITSRESEDLRSLFCAPEVTASRELRRVCALWLPRTFPQKPLEVSVQDGMQMDDVLKATFETVKWKPQVRLVSKDTIVQAMFDSWSRITVRAGDLVLIQAVE